jgi:DHA1 family bicyclomycin/chloramphenicol resistance-like MFS transporter
MQRPQPGTAEYYRLVIILGALSAMGPLAIDMYLPSFPAIARELGTTPSSVEVTAAVYFIGLAVGQAGYGPIADRLGRKPPVYFGLVLFALAAIGCAMASSVRALIALRVLQALGGCAEMVVARAMVRDCFDQRDSIRVLSLLLLVMGVAPILAPLIGGQLLVHFGWRSVFVALAAYALACLVAVKLRLPESLPPERRHRHSLAEVAGVYGMLLRDRAFVGYALCGGLVIAGMFGYIAGSPFVFIDLFGVAPERYGLIFGTNAIGIIGSSQINGQLARRVAPRAVLRTVLPVTAAAGVVLVSDAYTGLGGFAGILAPLFLCVSSVGFVLPNTTVLAMAPHGRIAGSASAVLGTTQFLLGAMAGGLVSAFNNGTAVPLAMVVAGCGIGAFAVHQTIPVGAAPVPEIEPIPQNR